MRNKLVLTGPKASVKLYDIIPTILLGCVCLGLVVFGTLYKGSNKAPNCTKRDCVIFKVSNESKNVSANLLCEDGWNNTLTFYYNDISTNATSTSKVECETSNGTSKCKHPIHTFACQSCHVCFYDVEHPCYSCQKQLRITIVEEGTLSSTDNYEMNFLKTLGFFEEVLF